MALIMNACSRRVLTLAVLFCFLLQTQNAHADALVTDRPGNGNAARVVDSKRVQVETSALYALEQGAATDVHRMSFPTWLRWGVLDGAELRLASSLVGWQMKPRKDVLTPDRWLGSKLQLLRASSSPCDLAFVFDVELPTGTGSVGNNLVLPEFRLLSSWSLRSGFALLLNLGADLPELGSRRVLRMIHVINLSYALPWWNQAVSVFVEYYGRLPLSFNDSAIAQIDAGLTWRITSDVQVDFYTQHALSNASPDVQLSLGFSARM
ncbi:MAG: transporter [Myxococcales bacterium]|nr:MAG: transporter [Myxococcales bacterium]